MKDASTHSKARIESILRSKNLDKWITGIDSFSLSDLNLPKDFYCSIRSNVRLGHLIEHIVSQMIHASDTHVVLSENVQIIKDKKTLGELDFIMKERMTQEIIHMELAYKFYLFDPGISGDQRACWIGPNRKDSLVQKIEKLKSKQLPLLHYSETKKELSDIDIKEVSQQVCFLVSLYVPYDMRTALEPPFESAVKGYYVDFDAFVRRNTQGKSYYIPAKTQWGIHPSANQNWSTFRDVQEAISHRLRNKQSVLVWEKDGNVFREYFVVWWAA